jgi:hypothetical protein
MITEIVTGGTKNAIRRTLWRVTNPLKRAYYIGDGGMADPLSDLERSTLKCEPPPFVTDIIQPVYGKVVCFSTLAVVLPTNPLL